MSKLFTFLMIMFVCITGVGATTLDEHIAKNCNKGCVDSETVLNAAVSQADIADIDFKLIMAVITVESGFIFMAKNRGNLGLMQVLHSAHRGKFRKNPFAVDENIRVGTSILKACLNRNAGHVTKALRCYNGGGDRKYATKVLKAYGDIRKVSFL